MSDNNHSMTYQTFWGSVLVLILLCVANVHSNSDYEVVFRQENTHSLRQFAYDSQSKSYYIGATNRIYRLNNNFHEMETVTDFPCFLQGLGGTCEETVPDNTNYIQLLLVADDYILTCGTHYKGLCERRNLTNISSIITSNRDLSNLNKFLISSAAESATLVGLSTHVTDISESKRSQILLFGKVYTQSLPVGIEYNPITAMQEEIPLTDGDSKALDPYTLKIEMGKEKTYLIKFISSLETDDFIYFLTIQKEESKIIKFCKSYDSNTKSVQSYEDLALKCNVGGNQYTEIQGGTFLKTADGTFVLVVTFVKDSKGAICVWSETEIQQELKRSREDRCRGNNIPEDDDVRALEQYNNFDFNCHTADLDKLKVNISIVPFCNRIEYPFLSLIIGLTPAVSNAVYTTNHSLTNVDWSLVNGLNTVYVGTTSGKVESFFLDTNSSGFHLTKLDTYDIGSQPVIGLKIYEERVFVVTESKIVRLKEPTCSDYTDCNQCMSSRNAACGWCVATQRCTEGGVENCQYYQIDNYWLPSVKGQCLKVKYLNGVGGISAESNTDEANIKVRIEPELGVNSDTAFKCQLAEGSTVLTETNYRYETCAFTNLPTSAGLRAFNILLDGKIIASNTFFFYECSGYKSCGECTETPQTACIWCNQDATCNTQASCSPNSRFNANNCPRISLQQDMKLPNGQTRDLTFTGQNLPDKSTIAFSCMIDGKTFTGYRNNDTHLTCRDVMVTYTDSKGRVDKSVSFKYGSGMDLVPLEPYQGGLQIQVYKCNLLSQNTKDCTYCKYLRQSFGYECEYCGSGCLDSVSCPASVECGNPEITKIEPSDGPVGGNTRVTISGINLGVKVSDLQRLTLAGVSCTNRQIDADGLNFRITCTSGPSNTTNSGAVSAEVNGKSSVNNNLQFHYKDPKILSVSPASVIQSGGAFLTITGSDFGIGNMNYIVQLKDVQSANMTVCSVLQPSPAGKIICRTNPISETTGFPRLQNIVVTFDQSTTKEKPGINYTANPVITGTNPKELKSIASGGLQFTVVGTGFTQDIQRMVVRSGNEENRCTYLDSEALKCTFPKLDLDARRKRSTSQPMSIELDGFSFALPSVQYVPDPTLYPLNENKSYVYDSSAEDRLLIKGMNLNAAANKNDFLILIGTGLCDFVILSEKNVSCKPPTKEPSPRNSETKLFLTVRIGVTFSETVGIIEYPSEVNFVLILVIVSVLVLLIVVAVAVFMYKRVKTKSKREMSEILIKMSELEEQAQADGEEEFAEMQCNITDIKRDVVSSGIPYFSYDKFILHVLFPKDVDSPTVSVLLQDFEETNDKRQKAMENFEKLLHNKFFLKSLICTLDRQRKLTMQDKAQFSSMLSIVMLGRMRDFFEAVHSLLSTLVDSTNKRQQHKTLFNRFESITLRLLSNWLFIALYPYLKDGGGSQLFMLYRALQAVIESRPVDDITGDAKNTLSGDHFLREKVDYEKLKLEIDLNANGYIYNCEVLDCDTISQVKSKCLYQVYKNKPASEMPSVEEVDLEWHEGKSGRLQLSDVDLTNEKKDGMVKINTLRHYNVRDGSHMALLYKYSPDEHDDDDPYMNFSAAPSDVVVRMPSVSEDTSSAAADVKKFHLTFDMDDDDDDDHTKKPASKLILKDKSKHLINLMNTKRMIQEYMSAVFDNVLDTDKIPTVVHYLFGVLESLANKNGVESDTLLCWKSESYAIRVWASLIARPETIFDIKKDKHVEPSLDVIKQVFIDCFHKTTVSKDSSLQKLLFALEFPDYQKKVSVFYKVLSARDQVPDEDFWREMQKVSKMQQELPFQKTVALQRLFKFITQYQEDIFTDLDEGPETKDLMFAKKLDDVFQLMHEDE